MKYGIYKQALISNVQYNDAILNGYYDLSFFYNGIQDGSSLMVRDKDDYRPCLIEDNITITDDRFSFEELTKAQMIDFLKGKAREESDNVFVLKEASPEPLYAEAIILNLN